MSHYRNDEPESSDATNRPMDREWGFPLFWPIRHARLKWWRWSAAVLLLICVAIVASALWRAVFGVDEPPTSVDQDSAPNGTSQLVFDLKRLSAASQNIAEKSLPAVVRVQAVDVRVDDANDELAQLFGSAPPVFGQGSGVIVDAEGYVLTNYHVVRGAREITVVVAGDSSSSASLVGHDALTDLAVLKIAAHGLETITWGDSDQLQVGEFVWAIGCPFGLEGSVSFGIVSAKNRDGLAESPLQAFLQTDAAVNPGNSGGPLVNADGCVVGINTAILGRAFQGISFAIPSNTARDIYDRLKRDGYVTRGYLGISLDPLSDSRARQLNLAPGAGVVVVSVSPDGPNASTDRQGNIQPGDIMTHWNGELISDPIQFSRTIAQTPIGTTAEATLVRDGRELKSLLVVGERPR